jgi:hypothetical protein
VGGVMGIGDTNCPTGAKEQNPAADCMRQARGTAALDPGLAGHRRHRRRPLLC